MSGLYDHVVLNCPLYLWSESQRIALRCTEVCYPTSPWEYWKSVGR